MKFPYKKNDNRRDNIKNRNNSNSRHHN